MTSELIRDNPADAGQPPLDPALLQVIRPSASRLANIEGTFVQLLHEDIEGLVRQLPGTGRPFCERMVRTVLWTVLADQPPNAIFEGLYWLGSTNQAEGFPSSEYVTVAHALVRVVREMSAERWTSTTGSAWIQFFMWMQPYVLAAAQQVAAQQEAARRAAAAQQEAARRRAFDQVSRRPSTQRGAADVDVTAVAGMLDDEDDDEDDGPGYGQIMMGMTLNNRRDDQ
ncbi:MAG TPA: hypothetical protein VG164_15815 [Trebonia sp.]|jgi:hypothetical protein|nr:hypothetical protein [Trebonia sp.]